MGFATLQQWRQHEVLNGICTHCGQVFAHKGPLAYKPAFSGQASMTFLGILPHATPCTKEIP